MLFIGIDWFYVVYGEKAKQVFQLNGRSLYSYAFFMVELLAKAL